MARKQRSEAVKYEYTIFEYLGINVVKQDGDEVIAECPFCEKKKLYVNRKKTTFNCKVCGKSGNAQTFLGDYFDHVCESIPLAELKTLAIDRRLPRIAFDKDKCLKWDGNKNQLWFICRSEDGKPVALRKVTPRRIDRRTKRGKRKILNLKSCPVGLVGTEDIKNSDTVYICEGEWDRIATMYMLRKCGKKATVVAVPGAGIFKEDWARLMQGKEVIILFDNDDPGKSGAAKTAKLVRGYAKKTRVYNWPVTFSDKYDMNDFVSDNMTRLDEVYDEIHSEENLSAYAAVEAIEGDKSKEAENQENLDPISVDELHSTFHNWLKLENCDMIDIIMGTLWSIHFPGNPIWLFIVAPSSGSKSETLMPISAWHRCYDMSTIKAKNLVSGYLAKTDPSLFGRINGKKATLVVKDLTPLLENPYDMAETFSILRDAYDGKYRQEYGNGAVRVYEDLHFGIICGVTYAIDEYNSVAMGERFLKFRSDKEMSRESDEDIAVQAIMNSAESTEMQKELREACVRCLARKLDPESAPKPTKEFAKRVAQLANFCACVRAVAPSDKFTDVQTATPSKEVPARIAVQLTKLARGLAVHFETSSLEDERIMHLLRRITIHTPDIITMRIIRALYDGYESEGGTVRSIASSYKNLTKPTVQVTLKKLSLTGAVAIVEDLEGNKIYRLSEDMYNMIKEQKIFDSLPKNDPLSRERRLVIRRKR